MVSISESYRDVLYAYHNNIITTMLPKKSRECVHPDVITCICQEDKQGSTGDLHC